MISHASNSDAQDIADLFNHYVQTSTAIFRDAVYTQDEILDMLENAKRLDTPVFVARNERLLGVAIYKPFRAYDGYKHTMEHSLYLDKSARGRGIGRKLFYALEKHARNREVHSFIGVITAENEESIAFHEKMGFYQTGNIPEVARKFDRWLEVTLMQKIL